MERATFIPLLHAIDFGWFAVSPPLIAEEPDIDEMCELIEKERKGRS